MILTPFPWLSTPVIQLRENLLTIGLLSFLAATYVSYRLFPTNRRPLGPPALPIIGNILSLPFEKPWLTFTAWKATFGMIPTVSFFLLSFSHPILFRWYCSSARSQTIYYHSQLQTSHRRSSRKKRKPILKPSSLYRCWRNDGRW